MPTFEEQIDVARKVLSAVQIKINQMQLVLKSAKQGVIMEGITYTDEQKTELNDKYLALKKEAAALWTKIL